MSAEKNNSVTTSDDPRDLATRSHDSVETEVSENTCTMKRAAAKKLIERYFYQLVDGCGHPNCCNEYCASSGKVKNLTANQAALQAVDLFTKDAKLCEMHPSKVPRTQSNYNRTRMVERDERMETSNNEPTPCSSGSRKQAVAPPKVPAPPPPYLDEEKLVGILEECSRTGSMSLLIRTLGQIFSSSESLVASFRKKEPLCPIAALLEKAEGKDLRTLKKEDVRALEGDLEKEEDCVEMAQLDDNKDSKKLEKDLKPDEVDLDIPSLRRCYDLLSKLKNNVYENCLTNAIITLSENIEFNLKIYRLAENSKLTETDLMKILTIIIELPLIGSANFFDTALPRLCQALQYLPVKAKARLVRVWAKNSKTKLKTLLDSLQQLITVNAYIRKQSNFSSQYILLQDVPVITNAVKLIKIIYYASVVAGELDPPEMRQEEDDDDDDSPFNAFLYAANGSKSSRILRPIKDLLEVELGVSVLDSREPYISFQEFYNESLSELVEMDKDFSNFKIINAAERKGTRDPGFFSFMNYSYILTPASKVVGLYYDCRIRMYCERRFNLFHGNNAGHIPAPNLKLKIRRDSIVTDALVSLELMTMENPKNLKKQLVIEFEDEQGLDEGGISKEFFHLIVEAIFSPDYGMFVEQPETHAVFFNPTSPENVAEFTLIGIVVGLALYNNIILDVHFPMVLYKKLMGKKGTFIDLEDWNPVLYSGLKQLLDYEGDDIEETINQTFRISYTDVFGTVLFHDLKENGDEILVNHSNKKEFVDLYADFLLNKSVEQQFRSFRQGFHMVTDESPLSTLFRPQEIELLICGSKDFNFNELQSTTEYDGGYTSETPVIKYFWETVHAMNDESKKKLLQFATGSDRIPVGGLGRLKFIVSRNGPDSDRLPTAHTCYNVLLLPEYSTKEKLQERLEKAINYSKGFGML